MRETLLLKWVVFHVVNDDDNFSELSKTANMFLETVDRI